MTGKFPSEDKTYEGYVMDHKVIDGIICYKVIVPALHGKNVKEANLPWIPATSADESGVKTNEIALDKGQMVHFYKSAGQGGTGLGRIVGTPQPKLGTSQMPGNIDLRELLGVIPKLSEKLPIKIPPDVKKQTNENGVEINKIVEKGEQWAHEVLKGLPVNGIGSMLDGVKLPSMKDLNTALAAAEDILGASEIGQLAGAAFNFGDLFNKLPLDTLLSGAPDAVKEAMGSIAKLTQNFDSGSNSKRVNIDVLVSSATQLLTGIKSYDELISNLNKLLTDTSFSQLGNIEVLMDGAFGQIKKVLDSNGNILSTEIPKEVENLINSMLSSATSIEAASGNLWESINSEIGGIVKRLPIPEQKQVHELFDKLKKV